MSEPLVSILVPMRNEEDFIESCLSSLCAQTYPASQLEILVLDGLSTDRSPDIVARLASADPRIRLVPNPGRSQAAGLNIGMHEAHGEIVVRADAHAVYGATYVATCVEHLVAGRAENVGGVQHGVGTTPFGKAVAAAQNSPLGAGGAAYRLAQGNEVRYVDTVWLGAWHRQTLLEIGGFDETMVPNEDYELNCRLRERGGRILLDASLPSTYYPRTSPARLWRQYWRYGGAKVRTWRRHPRSLLPRQMAAPLFVLALAGALIALPWTTIPAIFLIGFYVMAVVLSSLHAAEARGWGLFPSLLLIFPCMHLAWGMGFLLECLRPRHRSPSATPEVP